MDEGGEQKREILPGWQRKRVGSSMACFSSSVYCYFSCLIEWLRGRLFGEIDVVMVVKVSFEELVMGRN